MRVYVGTCAEAACVMVRKERFQWYHSALHISNDSTLKNNVGRIYSFLYIESCMYLHCEIHPSISNIMRKPGLIRGSSQ